MNNIMWIFWHRIWIVLHFWLKIQTSLTASQRLYGSHVWLYNRNNKSSHHSEVFLEVKGRAPLQANSPRCILATVQVIYYGLSFHFSPMLLFSLSLKPRFRSTWWCTVSFSHKYYVLKTNPLKIPLAWRLFASDSLRELWLMFLCSCVSA